MSSKCPVCNTENANELLVGGGNEYRWLCHRCGEFILEFPSGDLPYILADDIVKRGILSHWIRRRYEALQKKPADERGGRERVHLSGELVNNIIKDPRAFLPEQENNLVRWIGDTIKIGGEYVDVSQFAGPAIAGSATFEEFLLIFNHLETTGLITVVSGVGGKDGIWAKVTLSYGGWEQYQKLKRATSDSRKAFMAMQYNEPQLDDIVENVFREAVRQTGFELSILRDNPKAGLIDDRLRVEIRTARFLIADLTHGNRGAYWEAGYAEGLGKPVIYTCEKRKFKRVKPHFDTNHHETVQWDPEKPQEAAKKLKNTIRATLPAEAKSTDD